MSIIEKKKIKSGNKKEMKKNYIKDFKNDQEQKTIYKTVQKREFFNRDNCVSDTQQIES